MSGPEQLYREALRRHAADPVGYGAAIDATHEHEAFNPLCGDRVRLLLRLQDGRIAAAAFEGEACAVCLASASLFCAHMPGNAAEDIPVWQGRLEQALRGDGGAEELEFLEPLLGVRAYPSRAQCALLPWEAGRAAVRPAALGSE
jgi:nitrogen fixation NifU-like protein